MTGSTQIEGFSQKLSKKEVHIASQVGMGIEHEGTDPNIWIWPYWSAQTWAPAETCQVPNNPPDSSGAGSI